jgi:aryl-alcohol dehydrogenase-like predicted oxidoreductase
VLSRGASIVPIFGAKHVAYVEENAVAARITLSPDELLALEAAVPKGITAGPRYPEASLGVLNR